MEGWRGGRVEGWRGGRGVCAGGRGQRGLVRNSCGSERTNVSGAKSSSSENTFKQEVVQAFLPWLPGSEPGRTIPASAGEPGYFCS